MMASAALAVLAWCVVGTASAADYLATPSNFNRTVYGMSPGLRFSGDVAEFENDNAPMRSDNRDPTQWTISLDPASRLPLRFQFNGTGIKLVLRGPEQENASSFPPQVSLVTATGPSEYAVLNTTYSASAREWTVRSDKSRLDQNQWTGAITMPVGLRRLKLASLTYLYNIPLDANQMLNMTEMSASAPEVSPVFPVNFENETWLTNALSGGPPGYGPMELNSSTGRVVELPQNLPFLSVIGNRYWHPARGAECRFIFDPPFESGRGLDGPSQIKYTHVDTGNPYRVNLTLGGVAHLGIYSTNDSAFLPSNSDNEEWVFSNEHLLDQQLDPSIHYKFAIISGPTSSDRAILRDSRRGEYRSSSNPCNFTSIQFWRSVPDPSKQMNNATTSNDNSMPTDQPRGSTGMSAGAIAGTVVGIVLGAVLLTVLAVWLVRRRRTKQSSVGDLDGEMQDDTEPTPYVQPVGTSSGDSILDDRLAVLVDTKAPPSRRSRPRQRVIHREEDAGALPGEGADEDADLSASPPLYGEEWEPLSHNRGQSSTRRFPAGPRNHPPRDSSRFTAEEIKYLGQPVTAPGSVPGSSNEATSEQSQ